MRRTVRAPALCVSAALALGLHACTLCLWRSAPATPALIEIEGGSLEVALVESAPEPEETAPEPLHPEPPEPEPPHPEPPPEPPPIPPPKPPEITVPEPVKPAPAAKPSSPPKPAPKPARPAPHSRPNTAPNTTSKASAPGSGGTGAGKPAGKPAFLVRPSAAYPAESRAAGEQGVVLVRITVNAQGRPTAVSVARGSGFPRLDRAAVEGAWRCRVSHAGPGAQFDAPVRFYLKAAQQPD